MAALVAVAVAAPIVHLAGRAIEADDPWGQATSQRVGDLVISTLRLGATVMVLAVLLGLGLAWVLERVDLPGRRALGIVAVLPLVVPSYVAALAIASAVGPGGLVGEVQGLMGFWGAVIALVLATYPYVLLVARGALAGLSPELEEAARVLGRRRATVFFRVVLPQLRPALAAGGLLAVLYVLSDFGAVAIMRYDTLTRGIFLEYRSAFDRSSAAVLGVVLVVVTLGVIVAERTFRGRPPAAAVVAGRTEPRRADIGPWRWPLAALVSIPALVGVGVPVGVLLWWASSGSSRSESGEILSRAAATSVGLSVAAAVVCAVLAIPVAVVAVRSRSWFARVTEGLAMSGYALPGLVVALALVFLASQYAPWVYQTLPLVVAAYVVRQLPEAIASVRASLAVVDPTLEEAAATLGRGRVRALVTVTIPIVRGGLVAGAALVFLTAMKELPATLLLRPAGVDTLAIRVWTGASEGFYARAAPAGLLLVAVSALVLLPVWYRGGATRSAA